ncbi:undecaprenyl-diphosphate phosphatase [Aquimarina algiphila]|uniref:Undecaprenyl-diphosphate phosphatase n=1 Tax=Aquimarina algiphila TaxID=2047982 RepID=A0A554VI17_9FLAO|nr:undecaprenyl-diphosphate phosphatase [Aquimarina algiphila]TSE07277.1 undecaprenyl-diphosphate phosphatase [Aquimarina algiphila]
MKMTGNMILNRFRRRWQFMLWVEILLYSLGPAILVYFLFFKLLWSILVSIVLVGFMFIFIKPWRPNLKKVSGYIDQHLDTAEYSTGLLLLPEEQLSGLAKLQQYKVAKELVEKLGTISPPSNLLRGSVIMGLFAIVGFLMYQFKIINYLQEAKEPKIPANTIVFTATDSISKRGKQPKLEHQELIIDYPSYTQIPSFRTTKMDVKAVEGSKLTWRIKFNTHIKDVTIESMGSSQSMNYSNEIYTQTSTLNASGFYNFRYTDVQNTSYTSDLYAIEMIKDKGPGVEIIGLKQFTSFEFDENKKLSFKTSVTDDFGIADVYIIATVSKGSGESVKFREEKLSFDTKVIRGSKNLKLLKSIDLDKMKMEPGDELYFYIEALDRKQPMSNTSRSETFFAVIKDTLSDQFAVEGTMGVDLMPDYFRSQRQLIIDTEKLIREKSKLTKKEFNFKSNELGFDQKVLRLKYAEFMGDESESELVNQENPEISNEDEHGDEDHDEEDPLEQYTHKHDSDNEHNLVDHKEEDSEEKNDPLHEYLHNHEDPEESTLFTQSLKSKLRQALNEMWDAELYLRLYTPEKSLPYQYRALKLIQEIKNSARVYVHRIGFDPPPIKEDKRLTGKIEEVSNFRKKEELQEPEIYPSIRQTILRLEELIIGKEKINDDDRTLFEKAGNELAIKALENPGKYLKTLQKLKRTTENKKIPLSTLVEIQGGLFDALPELKYNAVKRKVLTGEINELLLKELEVHD